MAKIIRSVSEAIGIIEKEVEKMGEASLEKMGEETAEKKSEETSKYCVECNAIVTHPGAHFCKLCAAEFYNEVTIDNEGEGD